MLPGMEARRAQQQRKRKSLRRRQGRALQPHVRGAITPGMPPSRSACASRPVVRTRAGGLTTGADDPASIASAQDSARAPVSASPIAFTTSACGGNGQGRIVEVGVNRRDGKDPIVDPGARREVAAARRNQQQKRQARPVAAVSLFDHRVPGEALLPMRLGPRVPKLRQHPGQPLVRRRRNRASADSAA